MSFYPVHDNKFKIGIKGLSSTAEDMVPISCMENFAVSFDSGVEEIRAMEDQGWKRVHKTANGLTISLSGKRDIGDPGNDYVADLCFATGSAASTKFEWLKTDGVKVEFNCVVNVTSLGGDSTALDALEFEVIADGKPVTTPAAAE